MLLAIWGNLNQKVGEKKKVELPEVLIVRVGSRTKPTKKYESSGKRIFFPVNNTLVQTFTLPNLSPHLLLNKVLGISAAIRVCSISISLTSRYREFWAENAGFIKLVCCTSTHFVHSALLSAYIYIIYYYIIISIYLSIISYIIYILYLFTYIHT